MEVGVRLDPLRGAPHALVKVRVHEDWVSRKCSVWMHLTKRVGIHVDGHVGRIPSRLMSGGGQTQADERLGIHTLSRLAIFFSCVCVLTCLACAHVSDE